MFYDVRYDHQHEQTPHIITGAIEEYYPQKMIELTDYCGQLDLDPTTGLSVRPPKLDILKQMKDQYTIEKKIQSFEELNKVEKI